MTNRLGRHKDTDSGLVILISPNEKLEGALEVPATIPWPNNVTE